MQLLGINNSSSHSYIDNTVLKSITKHMTMQHGQAKTGFTYYVIITRTAYQTLIRKLGFLLS